MDRGTQVPRASCRLARLGISHLCPRAQSESVLQPSGG
jgi:hypothetical protein